MIECPICKVKNDDNALFCAECGQRFRSPNVGASPVQPASPSGDISLSKGHKLHSPILDGGYVDEYDSSAMPQKQPRRTPDQANSFGSQTRSKGGLRSPLLGGSTSDQYDDESEEDRSLFPHRRSHTEPPLSTTEDTKDHGRGLRSPLLGSADDEFPTPTKPVPTVNSRQSGKIRLHSPVLGSGNADFEFDDEDDVDEDPNVLRSPLLAAKTKLPLPEKPTPPASLQAANPSSIPISQPLTPPTLKDDVTWPQPKNQSFPSASQIRAQSDIQQKSSSSRPAAYTGTSDRNIDRASHDSEAEHSSKKAMWLVFPLALCLIFKLVYLMAMGSTLMQSLPFVLDQVGQLTVVICLIILATAYSK